MLSGHSVEEFTQLRPKTSLNEIFIAAHREVLKCIVYKAFLYKTFPKSQG